MKRNVKLENSINKIILDFGINRIHFTENARATLDLESTNSRDDFIKSTSTHTMADFNKTMF
jgi:thiamine-phosphate pyrophosphorylase